MHAHGGDAHAHATAEVLQLDGSTLRLELQAQHARAARQEVARVVKGVEAHQVRVEHASQQLRAHRERAENLGGREGGVQEKSNANLA